MKKMWLVVVVITTFVGFCGCEKTPVGKGDGGDLQGGEETERISIWECVIKDRTTSDITYVTLIIDSTTNLVDVCKYPKEDRRVDAFHLFRHGDRYFLQDNVLYHQLIVNNEVYTVDYGSLAITKISENEINLKIITGWPTGANYISNFLFTKIRE